MRELWWLWLILAIAVISIFGLAGTSIAIVMNCHDAGKNPIVFGIWAFCP